MKNLPIKKILLLLIGGVGVYAAWEIYKAFKNGERTIAGLVTAPIIAAKELLSSATNAVVNSTPVQGAIAVTQLPALTDASTQLTNITQADAFSDYEPGGRLYNQIAAQQGTAAADSNWAAVQKHYADEAAQDAADSSFFGLGNLFNYF